MEQIALYIHWPFCKAKCPYCDFNSHVREAVAQEEWRNAMLAELRWYAGQLDAKQRLGSIFFGGGTPSLMPEQTVAMLISEAERLFGFAPDIEITLEANPTSVESGKFRGYASGGVNRLSLGIQSLTPRHLQFLGREHSAEEAHAAIALASDIFQRFSFDLIYAIYDQTIEQWRKELAEALKISGNHLSLYQLTIEEGTKFYHLHQAGKLPVLSPDESAAYYEATQEMMEAAGMPAYEISNHARPGQESRHNLTYWRGGEYIGIGPGAHGRIKSEGARQATTNLRSPEKWLEQVQRLGHGQESALKLTQQEVREEKILMGIRLREGLPLMPWPQTLLKALQEEGLVALTDTHLIPTAKGRLVLNGLVEKLATSLAD